LRRQGIKSENATGAKRDVYKKQLTEFLSAVFYFDTYYSSIYAKPIAPGPIWVPTVQPKSQ
jgi:hypothetical protein